MKKSFTQIVVRKIMVVANIYQLFSSKIGRVLIRGNQSQQRITRRFFFYFLTAMVLAELVALCVQDRLPAIMFRIALSDLVYRLIFVILFFIPVFLWREGEALIWTYNPFANQLRVHDNQHRSSRDLRGMFNEFKKELPFIQNSGYTSLTLSTHLFGNMDTNHIHRLSRRLVRGNVRVEVFKKNTLLTKFSRYLLKAEGIEVRSENDAVITFYFDRRVSQQ